MISIIKPEFANTAYKYNSLYINDIFSKNVTLPELSEILDNGFVMKQFSVYIKPVKSLSVGQTTTKKLAKFIPDNSSVSFIYITDKQYLMTENYLGKNFEENEEEIREKNGQLLLF